MKTYSRLNRNRLLSHPRIEAAGTFIAYGKSGFEEWQAAKKVTIPYRARPGSAL